MPSYAKSQAEDAPPTATAFSSSAFGPRRRKRRVNVTSRLMCRIWLAAGRSAWLCRGVLIGNFRTGEQTSTGSRTSGWWIGSLTGPSRGVCCAACPVHSLRGPTPPRQLICMPWDGDSNLRSIAVGCIVRLVAGNPTDRPSSSFGDGPSSTTRSGCHGAPARLLLLRIVAAREISRSLLSWDTVVASGARFRGIGDTAVAPEWSRLRRARPCAGSRASGHSRRHRRNALFLNRFHLQLTVT